MAAFNSSTRHMLSCIISLVLFGCVLADNQATIGSDVVPGRYIVTFKPGISSGNMQKHLNSFGGVRAGNKQGPTKAWSGFFNGYTGDFNSTAVQQIVGSTDVLSVESVRIFRPAGGQIVTQNNAPWGLAAISHRKPNQTTYSYIPSARTDLWAYVVDTGVSTTHVDFEGRAFAGYNAVPNTTMVDLQGHGTHCAGIIAGKTYGVMKTAKIMAVKVFDQGGSTTDVVLDGFLWAVSNITLTPSRLGNAVISLSVGGGKSDAFNLAVNTAAAAGIPVVVAAGNSNADASLYSPSSATGAITVGAVDNTNTRATFSNYGPSVDIFAPGVYITSLGISSNTATAIMSGTSMACPHVSGLALYFMATKGVTTFNLLTTLIRSSLRDLITLVGTNSPNLLAYNGVA